MNELPRLKLNTGQLIPATGFGTWQIADGQETQQAVSAALVNGYRLIDTAKLYGNEKSVGSAIRSSGIPREEIFVTTKLWDTDQGYDSALKAFDGSLELLGLDYLDLYLIHWPGGKDRHQSWQALQEIYKSGRSKAVGVSNYTIEHLTQLLETSDLKPAVNQVEFHPFIYAQQKPLLEFCSEQGILIEAYSPLSRGRAIDEPAINEIAKTYRKTPAQILLRWAVQHGVVPLPKSTHAERIKANLDIFDFEISDEDMHSLNSLSTGERVTWDPSDTP